ncbi:MAG TPA: hypothetical protein VF637_09090 [Sphingomicrobium sp.]|jgi:hypothetical protein
MNAHILPLIIFPAALCASLYAIAATVGPRVGRIVEALRGQAQSEYAR